MGHLSIRSSRFLKEFPQAPQLLTAPDFGLQPARLLFLVDECPKTNRGPICSTIKGPSAQALPSGLNCRSRSSPAEPLRKPKPISYNPNRINKKLGSFLHFALPGLPLPRALAAGASKAPNHGSSPRCWNPSGRCTQEASFTSYPALASSAAPELPETGWRSLPVRGASASRISSHLQASSRKWLRAL